MKKSTPIPNKYKSIKLGEYYAKELKRYSKLGYTKEYIESEIIMNLKFGSITARGKKLIYNENDSIDGRMFIAEQNKELISLFGGGEDFYGTRLSKIQNIPIDFWKDYIFFSGQGICDIAFPDNTCTIRHNYGMEHWEAIEIIENEHKKGNYFKPPTYDPIHVKELIKFALNKLEYEGGYRPPDFRQIDLINMVTQEAEIYFGTNSDSIPSLSAIKRWVRNAEKIFIDSDR